MQFVTFGEIMMRLSAPDRLRFSQARSLDVTYGGAEANVAISLANFGLPSRYVTKLPNNPFGDGAVCQLREHGVDTTCVLRGGDRIGVYFLWWYMIGQTRRSRSSSPESSIGAKFFLGQVGFM
jgi:2-dehydro-3-deoxygluconokinase